MTILLARSTAAALSSITLLGLLTGCGPTAAAAGGPATVGAFTATANAATPDAKFGCTPSYSDNAGNPLESHTMTATVQVSQPGDHPTGVVGLAQIAMTIGMYAPDGTRIGSQPMAFQNLPPYTWAQQQLEFSYTGGGHWSGDATPTVYPTCRVDSIGFVGGPQQLAH